MINNHKNFRKEFNSYMENVKPSEKLINNTLLLLEQEQSKIDDEKAKSNRNRFLNLLSSSTFIRYGALTCTVLLSLFAVKLYNNTSNGEIPVAPIEETVVTTEITTSASCDTTRVIESSNGTSYLNSQDELITNTETSISYTYIDTIINTSQTNKINSILTNTTAVTNSGIHLYEENTNHAENNHTDTTLETDFNNNNISSIDISNIQISDNVPKKTIHSGTDWIYTSSMTTKVKPFTTMSSLTDITKITTNYNQSTTNNIDIKVTTIKSDNSSTSGSEPEDLPNYVPITSRPVYTTIEQNISTTTREPNNNSPISTDITIPTTDITTISEPNCSMTGYWIYDIDLENINKYDGPQTSNDNNQNYPCTALRLILKQSKLGYYYDNYIDYAKICQDFPFGNNIKSINCVIPLTTNDEYCDILVIYDNISANEIKSSMGDFATLFQNDDEDELVIPIIIESFENIDLNYNSTIGDTQDIELLLQKLAINKVPLTTPSIQSILSNVRYLQNLIN